MKAEIKERIEQVRHGEVPKGYRNQWHLAPQEWDVYELNKLCQKSIEKNKNNRLLDVLTNSAVYGIVTQGDYFEKDIVNEENISGYYVVNEGDYVYNPRISQNAPFGPINRNDTGIKGIVSPLYTVFRQRRGSVNCDYLQYYFASSGWHKYVYSVANYGVRFDRMNITDEDLMHMPISLPSTVEQKRIVEILAHCDKVIELKKQLIEEKRRQKKWLSQNLLDPDSGVRLPGFEGEWVSTPIKNVAEVVSGGTPCTNNASFWNGPILWCTPTDISFSGKYISKTAHSITQAGLDSSSAKLLPAGAVLMCSRATIGAKAIAIEPITTNQGFKNFVCRDRLHNEFFYYYLDIIMPDFIKLASGNTFKELAKKSIDNYIVLIPTISEQKAIANVLSKADHEIELLEQELGQWQTKKKSLMQLLLTGLVRVKI